MLVAFSSDRIFRNNSALKVDQASLLNYKMVSIIVCFLFYVLDHLSNEAIHDSSLRLAG